MNRYLTNYATWKNIQLNEAWGPGRTKQTAGMGQKVVGIPVDAQNFKIKIIRDLRVIEDGKLSEANWQSILQWLKAQPKWPQFYPALNDMTKNMVVYSVKADTDRKQMITFTISPKTEGLPADRSAFLADELKTLMKDPGQATLLANKVKQAEQAKTDTGVAAGKFEPISFEQVKALKADDTRFKLIKAFFIKMLQTEDFRTTKEAIAIKSEIKAGQLGDKSILLLKALVAGFGFKDEYGDPNEEMDQRLIDGISAVVNKSTNESRRLYEAAPEFNMDAFIAAFTGKKPGETKKPDITIPEGGLVKGKVAKGDETLKKVQQLIIDKYKDALGENELFKKFMSYGADGAYGPTTERIISGVKGALKMSDTDGTVITQELVDKMQSDQIVESFVYLHPMGYIVEQFSVSAFASTTSTSVPAKKKKEDSEAKPEEDSEAKPEEESSAESGDSAFSEIEEALQAAHQRIVDLYSDEEFFKEYKGTFNDDEDEAVKEIFGSEYKDSSSWWYSQIRKPYLIPTFNKIEELKGKKVDQDKVSQCVQEMKKFIKIYSELKEKTLGGTSDNSYAWSYKSLDGTKTSYSVDTDF